MDRREFLKAGTTGAVGTVAASLVASNANAQTDPNDKPAFVLVHGSWHGAWTWNLVTPLLVNAGHACIAIELPGAGVNTNFPDSYLKRPLDTAAFASELSPVADITQDQRTGATVQAIKQAANAGNGKVVLVGHSMGGLTITPAAEAISDVLHSVVYIAAVMLPTGMAAGKIFGHESMSDAVAGTLVVADPAKTGAFRIDPRSQDSAYIATMKKAFYADLTSAQFRAVVNLLHSDEPAEPAGVASNITAANFGNVRRHFVRTLQDFGFTIAAQDHMIDIVDKNMGNKTITHTLDSSHSPFISMPDALARILIKAAA